jgi:arginine N-succinyltransferase
VSVVRLARPEDLDTLVALAATVDGLMTTMPRTPDEMRRRLERSRDSVQRDVQQAADEVYLFVLVDEDAIVGLSAVYATVGLDRPFYNYKVSTLSRTNPELGVRVDTRLLHLVNDYTGFAEVGTLYLHPDHRGGGRGRLLSLSRLLYVAANRHRFPQRIMAEIRGWIDPAGRSPFWEAVGRRFFQLELADADVRSAQDVRFIADLMPTYPLYVDLLPPDAQAAIGRCHDEAVPAAQMLVSQGFKDHGYVDIFDAGPCLDTWIDDVHAVRRSVRTTLLPPRPEAADAGTVLVARHDTADFAAVTARGTLGAAGFVPVEPLPEALAAETGDTVLVYVPPGRTPEPPR